MAEEMNAMQSEAVREYTTEEITELIKNRNKDDHSKRLEIYDAIISDCDMSGWDLTNIDFSYTRFENVNLNGADFTDSSIKCCSFYDSPLREACFHNANMQDAILRYIDMTNADITGADLHHACLEYTILDGVKDDENTKWYRLLPPAEGAFIAWKCCTELRVVQLLVPADAKRVSATAETCRCSKAKVLSIKSIDETVSYDWAQSTVDPDFYYERGKWVEPANGFEENRWRDSSQGIHFFMERQQCVDYQAK